jgi:hypothetical protein
VAAALVLLLAWGCGDATSPADDTPARILVVAGDTQFAAVAMPVRVAPVVEVRNADGKPLAGVTIDFVVSDGGGWTTTTQAVTNASGQAATAWYLGPAPGNNQRLTATAGATLTATVHASALPLRPDSTYRGRGAYIELTAGSLPLVLSAPHGGALTPAELPDRTSGETVTDTNALELARAIAAAFESAPASGRTWCCVSSSAPSWTRTATSVRRRWVIRWPRWRGANGTAS